MTDSPFSRARRVVGATVLGATLALGGTMSAFADAGTSTPTAEAKRAGVEPGNAPMGWRAQQPYGGRVSRYGIDAVTAGSFTPSGVLGIDVSSWQRNLNFAQWARYGRQFAFVKSTEGSTYRNPYFASQVSRARAAGMFTGAYHFANPAGRSGTTQARYFVKRGGAWVKDGRTLPGVLDIEYNPYGKTCYGLSKRAMRKWIAAFLTEYKVLTGRDAIIYTTTDWWTRCTGNTARFSRTNPLWLARYGTRTPGTLPGTWTTATFWQYTSRPIDQNKFSSTRERLVVLATGVDPKNS